MYFRNPRVEAADNDFVVTREQFRALGLEPTTLSDGLLVEIAETAEKYKERCIMDKIICTSLWSQDQEVDAVGSELPVSA
jgi:UDP-sulfoquinovose synthase